MHEYYFKIKKGDIEFECSTTDKVVFEQKLSDWINGLVNGACVDAPVDEAFSAETENMQEVKPQRSGFLEVKSLASINDMQTPHFEIFENKGDEKTSELNFENALQESIEKPKTEVKEKQESLSVFEEYIQKYKPEVPLDYLVVAALYVSNFELNERFSIKQINSKLVPLTGTPIDHSIMQEAIEQGYLRVVPDLTGEGELTEYALTQDGESYFVE